MQATSHYYTGNMATSCRGLVVNFATDAYLPVQERLRASCERVGQEVACYRPGPGFTPHSETPYFFKVESLRRASSASDLLLWLDASIVLTGKPLDTVFEHVSREGYAMIHHGWNNAQWCNDRSLASFGFTRDQAERQQHISCLFLGLNLKHPLGRLILDEAERHRGDFTGQWDNSRRTESQDPRCLGHRHDQSVFSLVAARHGLDVHRSDDPPWCCYGPDPGYLLNAVGRHA